MIRSGLEALQRTHFDRLEGRRIGLLTNPGAVTRDLTSAYDLFRAAPEFELCALFSPEHGLAAAAGDGVHIASTTDPRTGIPIHSLYGASLRPTPEMLAGLDALVCDLQDIGVRFYTYAWTIAHALEAAGAAGLEVILLDRPNPLGAVIDGPQVAPGWNSIVGYCPVPIRHGLTLGELMRMFNALWNPTPVSLLTVACPGYQRGMAWEDTGLPFVPTSPAMPHLSTVRHYPGACLLEGTNLSEGRGTALPFEICGAPYIEDEIALAAHLNAQAWPGVRYRPHVFQPSAGKYAGQVCRGVQAHITAGEYRPLLAWVGVICAVRRLYPQHFAWRPPYESSDRLPFDLLAGGPSLRGHIEADVPLETLAAGWDALAAAFQEQSAAYLLY
jgi:uncharacterized protein YbbC (DUF1343 family)